MSLSPMLNPDRREYYQGRLDELSLADNQDNSFDRYLTNILVGVLLESNQAGDKTETILLANTLRHQLGELVERAQHEATVKQEMMERLRGVVELIVKMPNTDDKWDEAVGAVLAVVGTHVEKLITRPNVSEEDTFEFIKFGLDFVARQCSRHMTDEDSIINQLVNSNYLHQTEVNFFRDLMHQWGLYTLKRV